MTSSNKRNRCKQVQEEMKEKAFRLDLFQRETQTKNNLYFLIKHCLKKPRE